MGKQKKAREQSKSSWNTIHPIVASVETPSTVKRDGAIGLLTRIPRELAAGIQRHPLQLVLDDQLANPRGALLPSDQTRRGADMRCRNLLSFGPKATHMFGLYSL